MEGDEFGAIYQEVGHGQGMRGGVNWIYIEDKKKNPLHTFYSENRI